MNRRADPKPAGRRAENKGAAAPRPPRASRRSPPPLAMTHQGSPPTPLPGTQRSPRGLFIDRWGTLLGLPPAGYARGPQDVVFRPGVLDSMFRATQSGWNLYLLGNEESVAFGDVSDESWADTEALVLETLADFGVAVRRNYACLDHPRGRGRHRADSVFHLPNTGAFYHAAHTDGVDIAQSWVVGDSTLELVAGWRAGLRLAAVETGLALSDGEFEVDPDLTLPDLCAVLARLCDQTAELLH